MLKSIIATTIVISTAITGGIAHAGEEKKCAKQYSFEEHLILEWAALGGDPHAQFAITQCAFPQGTKKLTQAEKTYALQWLTLASCEVLDSEETMARNIRTRRLKASSDLSFRRFGGKRKDEKMSTRDKMFREYRLRKTNELKDRNKAIASLVSAEDRRIANDALIERFARMGDLGLLKLSELSSCEHFNASSELKAASWSAADDAWETSPLSEIFGKSDRKGWAISKESQKHLASLSATQQNTATLEKKRLLKTSATEINALEERAALADIQNLATVHAHVGELGAPVQSVTLAVQYALEALNMIEFVNGPDNDYGPSTIDAVKKLQAAYGAPQTRWLSHEQVRDTICKAAVESTDPISLYNIALMHANGWGFKKDLNKAQAAITQAENAMTVQLSNLDGLEEWKQDHYPRYVSQIEISKSAIGSAWQTLPANEKSETASDICVMSSAAATVSVGGASTQSMAR